MSFQVRVRRQKVLRYVKYQRHDTLAFSRPNAIAMTNALSRGDRVPPDPQDDDALVEWILDESYSCYSIRAVDGVVETGIGRYRSSLDIWRHAKLYRPEISIFDVMESLYRIRDRIYGHYCITVKRMVFMSMACPHTIPNYKDHVVAREYGIKFSMWKSLQLPDSKSGRPLCVYYGYNSSITKSTSEDEAAAWAHGSRSFSSLPSLRKFLSGLSSTASFVIFKQGKVFNLDGS